MRCFWWFKQKQTIGLKVNFDHLKLVHRKLFTTGIKDSAKDGKETNAYISVCNLASYYDSHIPGVRKIGYCLLLVDKTVSKLNSVMFNLFI